MNSFLKTIIFSLIFITILSTVNATAATGVMRVYDENGAHHANAGEKFTISVITPDNNISSDSNYAVFFRWIDINFSGRTGTPKYWDLNAVDGNIGALSDENTAPGRILGGQCLSLYHGGPIASFDMNVIDFIRADANTFDVNITIPKTDANHNDMNGKVGILELWRLAFSQDVGLIPGYTCSQVDANALFIVGPALVATIQGAPIEQPAVASIDGNITVFGYGFPIDGNIVLKFRDDNGSFVDLNTLDINSTAANNPYGDGPANERDWNSAVIVELAQTNTGVYYGATAAQDRNRQMPKATLMLGNHKSSFQGMLLLPDANGDFDVNVMVPFTTNLAGPGGSIPDNNIFADINGGYAFLSGGSRLLDANIISQSRVIVTPGFTMANDVNVSVLVCSDLSGTYNCGASDTNYAATGRRVPMETAMQNSWIRNMENVKGIMVELKDSDLNVVARIKLNSDVNIAMGPRRDYASGTTASSGRAKMDTDTMPEFGTDPNGNPIDANITLFNLKSTGSIPFLARNGKVCPVTVCKNLDLGVFSWDTVYTATDGTPSWVYNSTTGDGNLSFRVSGFSEYSAGTLTATVTGDSNSGREYFTRDGNLTVTFTYKDTNYLDQNYRASHPDANFSISIYLSKAQCGQHYLLYTDYNILDMNGINCAGTTTGTSGWSGGSSFENKVLNDSDGNVSTTQSCTISLDLSKYADAGDANFTHWLNPQFMGAGKRLNRAFPDLRTSIMGSFYIDVNITAPRSQAVGNTVCATSDANTIINKPQLKIWDSNFNNSRGSTFFDFNKANWSTDANLYVDFNIQLQDSNLSIGDMNLSVYYSQTQGDRNNVIFRDLNLFFADNSSNSNAYFVKCNVYDRNGGVWDENQDALRDANCVLKWNVSKLLEGRYFIDMILAPSSPDANRGAGSWAFDTNNRFAALTSHPLKDTNSTLNPAGINDTNNPIIRSVTGASTTTGNCTPITMDVNDTSNIKRFFYATIDNNGSYTDNNMDNVISACIGVNESRPKTVIYYLKASDYMDLNSATTTHTITYEGSGGTTTPPGGGAGGGGGTGGGTGGGGETTPGREILVEKTVKSTATAEEITAILTEAGYTPEQITEMASKAENANIQQKIVVEKVTNADGSVSYETTVKIKLKNNGKKHWKNVKIVLEIPKAIATDASEITSTFTMKVLKADPIIEFTVPQVEAGQEIELAYNVAKQVSDATMDEMEAPLVTGYTVVTPRPAEICTPSWSCTTWSECSASGTQARVCSDSSNCGTTEGKPAESQACTYVAPPAAAGIDMATTAIIVIVIVIVVGLAYMLVARKPKNKLTYKK